MNKEYLYQTTPELYGRVGHNRGLPNDDQSSRLEKIQGADLFSSSPSNHFTPPVHSSVGNSTLQGSIYASTPILAARRVERPITADDARWQRPPRSPALQVPAAIADAAAAIVERSHIELEGTHPVFRHARPCRSHDSVMQTLPTARLNYFLFHHLPAITRDQKYHSFSRAQNKPRKDRTGLTPDPSLSSN
jgi:hypothetical protein